MYGVSGPAVVEYQVSGRPRDDRVEIFTGDAVKHVIGGRVAASRVVAVMEDTSINCYLRSMPYKSNRK